MTAIMGQIQKYAVEWALYLINESQLMGEIGFWRLC